MKYCNYCMNPISSGDVFCKTCGKNTEYEAPAHHLLPGTVLNGKFTVGAALGEGGFGITYIGRDNLLDMRVAIKEYFPNGYVSRSNTVTPTISTSTTEQRKEFFDRGREKFLNEARILAKFSGEAGIVDVRDFFESNNTAYIVMEFLDGETLKNHIKRTGVIAPETALDLLMPVMNSLKKVHKAGLIHRDISPDNIMLLGDGKVKLLDFGAARDVSAGNKSLSVMLKPGYAPEEQYRSKGNQGPWTDVYALAATLYKCITGVTPDDSTQRVFSDEVKKPSELGIMISPAFEAALMKGMNVLQKDRYQSIDDFLNGLSEKGGAAAPAIRNTISDPIFVPDDDNDKTVGIGGDIPLPEIDDEKTVGVGGDIPMPEIDDEKTVGVGAEIPEYAGVSAAKSEAFEEIPVYASKEKNKAPVNPAPYEQISRAASPDKTPETSFAPAGKAAPAAAKKPKSKKKLLTFFVIGLIAVALIVILIISLTSDPEIPVEEYADNIVGSWEGKIDISLFDIEDIPDGFDTEYVLIWTFYEDGYFECTFERDSYLKLLENYADENGYDMDDIGEDELEAILDEIENQCIIEGDYTVVDDRLYFEDNDYDDYFEIYMTENSAEILSCSDDSIDLDFPLEFTRTIKK